MTFATSIAGPSRLPFQAAAQLSRGFARRYATGALPSSAAQDGDDVLTNNAAVEDKESKAARKHEKEVWATREGYKKWLKTEAGKFRETGAGDRATWLGGSVPYGTNPTFKPPPPLGNDTQDHIYAEMSRKNRTAGQVAEQFSVSKARVEAIRKLKEIEREMVRQGLPLQEAFQRGMEPLLGIRSIRDTKSKSISDRLARDEASYRGGAMGTRIEKEEEERFEAGIGEGGAFSSKMAEKQPIERTVWEFRSEEMMLAERAAEAAARSAASSEGLAAELLAEAEVAPSTPEQEHIAHQEASEHARDHTALPSHQQSNARTTFRFVDTSSTEPKSSARRKR